MNHPDEHTIELFVLKDPGTRKRQREIAAHLKICAGCRALASEISAFYASAEREHRTRPANTKKYATDLIRRPRKLDPVFYGDRGPIELNQNKSVTRFSLFVRKHPRAAGVALLALVLALTLFVNYDDLFEKPNPSFVRLDFQKGTLEVFDATGEKLWQKPIPPHPDEYFQSGKRTKYAQVVDLDHDGRNEVVTIANIELGPSNNILYVLDGTGAVIQRTKLGKPFAYLNEQFRFDFGANALLTDDLEGDDRPEIYVGVANYHSPYAVYKLDNLGRFLGSYWTYGHLSFIDAHDIDRDGQREIVTGGIHDLEGVPVLFVLNPHQIEGESKSSIAQGFSFPLSSAEKYVVRFPSNDMSIVLNMKPGVAQFKVIDTSAISLHYYVGRTKDAQDGAFEYILSNDLKVIDAKLTDPARRVRKALIEQGKLKEDFSSDYLQDLKDGVHYWDGLRWHDEVVRVGTPMADSSND